MKPWVNVAQEGALQIIRLQRADKRNAVNFEMACAISSAIDELEARPELSACVITGDGGDFCAGMDLKAFTEGALPRVPGGGFAGITERRIRKPLIAAVEGHALAGGFEIVLAADLVVASETARFGLPEVKRGLMAGGGGVLRLARRIPFNIAMELCLTGGFLEAPAARQYGLINRLVPPGRALDAARKLACEIGSNGPLAISSTKQVIVDSHTWPEDEMFARQRPALDAILRSDDAHEGARAFIEKRPAQWRNQ
ncbi:crotonase/enoyl-CoA hydratase family protein [Hydrogenophaga sp. BPS33]|uniref:crotonase/enoyl-CoA hydratase family protein n=1 Tax=Hydrogenophaga sp. BPS33 TaxID=2651974 RepID=UPI00131FD84C|nr:crotonase/enoyl-CoA hydratase family protein [Hydrogenophaga sp. BPS33]QHE84779.1 crotonase/enoyl-CoA hydratase family protein [Hydrogenophaga sp. BPS33]